MDTRKNSVKNSDDEIISESNSSSPDAWESPAALKKRADKNLAEKDGADEKN